MAPKKLSQQFKTLLATGTALAEPARADALLLLVDGQLDWAEIKDAAAGLKTIVASDDAADVTGATEAGLFAVVIDKTEAPVYERLTQTLLDCVADDLLANRAQVVALYSGFDPGTLDSISLVRLDERLGRLTSRDLRKIETRVPLDTLKTVVDLAVEIGREGREGKPVGTMFVLGDSRKVIAASHPTGFDPVKGYSRGERNINDMRVREGLKEIAQMDGAFIISSDGTIEAAARYIDAPAAAITLSKGLGTRHWAAAAITRATKALAVVVSESNGTVRIFQNGEIILRIEPLRRPMKWQEFDHLMNVDE
jgi:DNA integrity scanning protein DisA with diadenylate cyclase activity